MSIILRVGLGLIQATQVGWLKPTKQAKQAIRGTGYK